MSVTLILICSLLIEILAFLTKTEMHFQVNEEWVEEVLSNFTEKNGMIQRKTCKDIDIGVSKDTALTKAETRGRTELLREKISLPGM